MKFLQLLPPLRKPVWLPLENPLLAPSQKKSFRRPWTVLRTHFSTFCAIWC